MLVTLDPGRGQAADELLEYLGLRFSSEKLAHERKFIPLTRTPVDRYNLVTDSFSHHAATTIVSRYSKDLPVLFHQAGSLDKAENTDKKINFIVRSQGDTWSDRDGDLSPGKDEKIGVFNLAAAVEMKVAGPEKQEGEDTGEDPAREGQKPSPQKRDEMRVVVFADSDVFADDYLGLIRVGPRGDPPNMILLAEVLKWLLEEEQIGGVAASEEDVRVAHTRNEDVFWFYATVFAVPLCLLGVGAGTRWGRGRGRRAGR